jgi:hypothetical protein
VCPPAAGQTRRAREVHEQQLAVGGEQIDDRPPVRARPASAVQQQERLARTVTVVGKL